MTKFIAIHSGKGGVGKTTVAINLAHALHEKNRKVILVDANLDTPHIALHLGLVNPQHHLQQFLDRKKSINSTIFVHESGLRFIPALHGAKTLSENNHTKIHEIFEHLDNTSEFVIIDCPSGFSPVLHEVLKHADESIIITTPTLSSLYDAQKTLEIAKSYNHTIAAVIINHSDLQGAITKNDIIKTLNNPYIYKIETDEKIPKSQNESGPSHYLYPHTQNSKTFTEIAKQLTFEN